MNEKFESNSNDYDESNLNRFYSVLWPESCNGDLVESNEFRMDADASLSWTGGDATALLDLLE